MSRRFFPRIKKSRVRKQAGEHLPRMIVAVNVAVEGRSHKDDKALRMYLSENIFSAQRFFSGLRVSSRSHIGLTSRSLKRSLKKNMCPMRMGKNDVQQSEQVSL
jgi:hypothetical protein